MVHHLRKGAAIASARRRLGGARTSSHNREHVRIERLVRPHHSCTPCRARPIPGIATVRVSPPRCPPTHGPPCALLQPLSVLSAHLFVSTLLIFTTPHISTPTTSLRRIRRRDTRDDATRCMRARSYLPARPGQLGALLRPAPLRRRCRTALVQRASVCSIDQRRLPTGMLRRSRARAL
jgi:hypothetical protein